MVWGKPVQWYCRTPVYNEDFEAEGSDPRLQRTLFLIGLRTLRLGYLIISVSLYVFADNEGNGMYISRTLDQLRYVWRRKNGKHGRDLVSPISCQAVKNWRRGSDKVAYLAFSYLPRELQQ